MGIVKVNGYGERVFTTLKKCHQAIVLSDYHG